MSNKYRSIGVWKILISDPLETGLMPELSAMTEIGELVDGESSIAKEEDTEVDIINQETQEVDSTVLSAIGSEKAIIVTRNLKPSNLLLAFGGSMASGKWNAPTSAYRGDYKAVKFISRETEGIHSVVDFPYCKMTALSQNEYLEDSNGSIKFSLTKQTPTNASGVKQTPKYKYGQPAAPTVPVTDDTANSFGFTETEGFDATDFEYSDDTGSTWTDVTVNPITGITGAVGIGEFLVRVKEDTTAGTPDTNIASGFTLANTVAFTS